MEVFCIWGGGNQGVKIDLQKAMYKWCYCVSWTNWEKYSNLVKHLEDHHPDVFKEFKLTKYPFSETTFKIFSFSRYPPMFATAGTAVVKSTF